MHGVKEHLFVGLVRIPPTMVADFVSEATSLERVLQLRIIVILTEKKDGTLCFCIDFSKLNKAAIKMFIRCHSLMTNWIGCAVLGFFVH